MTHYGAVGSSDDPAERPEDIDPDYEHHGGFPEYGPANPGAGFRQFVANMRRLQDLAVSADPDDAVWDEAAQRAAALVQLLEPYLAAEGQAPAGRTPDMPGMGSLLLPPWTLTRYEPDGVEMTGSFSRFHVGATPRYTAGCCRCCSTTCSAWSPTPPDGRSAGPRSCMSTTERSPRSMCRWWSAGVSPAPKAAGVRRRRIAGRRRGGSGRGQRTDGATTARPALVLEL